MGPLAGLTYREVTRKLRAASFVFDRHAKGSHELWRHPVRQLYVVVVNHTGDLREGTVRAMLKQAGLTIDEFRRL